MNTDVPVGIHRQQSTQIPSTRSHPFAPALPVSSFTPPEKEPPHVLLAPSWKMSHNRPLELVDVEILEARAAVLQPPDADVRSDVELYVRRQRLHQTTAMQRAVVMAPMFCPQ